jgi:tripeptidyl-peptidase I
MVGIRPKTEYINGGYRQEENRSFHHNGEADLDFEYTMALTLRPAFNFHVGVTSFRTNTNGLLAAIDKTYCNGLDKTVDVIFPNVTIYTFNRTADCGTVAQVPAVLVVYYGWNEADFPDAYLIRQCLEFLKLGL